MSLVLLGGAWLIKRAPMKMQGSSATATATTQAPTAVPGPPQLRGERIPVEQVKAQIDADVFNAVGPRAYYISRMQIRPPGDALEYVDQLLALSGKGDATATFGIHLAVMDCKNSIRGSSDPQAASFANASQHMSMLAAAERKLGECAALLLDKQLMSIDWITLAAEQGSIEAKLAYGMDAEAVLGSPGERLANPGKAVAWRETTLAYLQEVAATGSLDAMARLSNAYEQGVIVEKNPEFAYAYALVSNRIMPDPNREHLVRSMEEGLSMKQQESAAALSHQIYQSCCQP